ncbi:tryptophan-rich sensory protein [Aeromicrobium sp. 636]|uniref:Tryptophan-rich sensory protein n=1 Tax=Aeromicrobium senzhongii TaxID=2663859 RepID=A0A8I0EUD1_9ACTN|nr:MULTISPECIES: TspO/MBR family protein [Aeromicrobium]MBC9225522.1 tryptophan-rich sensory protein [Aeromicrobium senzhongii]MCQ3997632.1 tryptophan-rich sensory protein [Aeromicrobium sp. 636]
MKSRTLASSIAAPVAAAVLGSVATSTGMKSLWYRTLRKPSIQPPGPVFPVVWTGLYASTAWASVDAQAQMTPDEASTYRRKLALNMALNAGWCWSFFRGHQLVPSIAVAGALAASSADLARTAGGASRRAGWALVPYTAWNTFATVLTAAIWRKNRNR